MKSEEKIKAGETFIITNGEYSDFDYEVMRALKDFDLADVARSVIESRGNGYDFEERDGDPEYCYNTVDYLMHVIRSGFAELVELRTIHVGEYGEILVKP